MMCLSFKRLFNKFFPLVAALSIVLINVLLSFLIIKNISDVLLFFNAGEKICNVFVALKNADFSPWYSIIACSLCVGIMLCFIYFEFRYIYKNTLKIAIFVATIVVFSIVCLCVSMFFMEVNGVRFGDIVLSLLDVASKGVLDNL